MLYKQGFPLMCNLKRKDQRTNNLSSPHLLYYYYPSSVLLWIDLISTVVITRFVFNNILLSHPETAVLPKHSMTSCLRCA